MGPPIRPDPSPHQRPEPNRFRIVPETHVAAPQAPAPPAPLNPSPRLLLGPGPSEVHPRVLAALGMPLLGHLDPEFVALMDETQAMLRYVFQTENRLTLAVSGTGSAGGGGRGGDPPPPGGTKARCGP